MRCCWRTRTHARTAGRSYVGAVGLSSTSLGGAPGHQVRQQAGPKGEALWYSTQMLQIRWFPARYITMHAHTRLPAEGAATQHRAPFEVRDAA